MSSDTKISWFGYFPSQMCRLQGWIRETSNKNNLTVPDVLCYLIMKFFQAMEYFIDGEEKTLIAVGSYMTSSFHSYSWINAEEKENISRLYTFKILSPISEWGHIRFNIIGSSQAGPICFPIFSYDSNGYSTHFRDNYGIDDTFKLQQGDLISIDMNVNKNSIRMRKNKQKWKKSMNILFIKSFKNETKALRVKMQISLTPSEQVQLIDHFQSLNEDEAPQQPPQQPPQAPPKQPAVNPAAPQRPVVPIARPDPPINPQTPQQPPPPPPQGKPKDVPPFAPRPEQPAPKGPFNAQPPPQTPGVEDGSAAGPSTGSGQSRPAGAAGGPIVNAEQDLNNKLDTQQIDVSDKPFDYNIGDGIDKEEDEDEDDDIKGWNSNTKRKSNSNNGGGNEYDQGAPVSRQNGSIRADVDLSHRTQDEFEEDEDDEENVMTDVQQFRSRKAREMVPDDSATFSDQDRLGIEQGDVSNIVEEEEEQNINDKECVMTDDETRTDLRKTKKNKSSLLFVPRSVKIAIMKAERERHRLEHKRNYDDKDRNGRRDKKRASIKEKLRNDKKDDDDLPGCGDNGGDNGGNNGYDKGVPVSRQSGSIEADVDLSDHTQDEFEEDEDDEEDVMTDAQQCRSRKAREMVPDDSATFSDQGKLGIDRGNVDIIMEEEEEQNINDK